MTGSNLATTAYINQPQQKTNSSTTYIKFSHKLEKLKVKRRNIHEKTLAEKTVSDKMLAEKTIAEKTISEKEMSTQTAMTISLMMKVLSFFFNNGSFKLNVF